MFFRRGIGRIGVSKERKKVKEERQESKTAAEENRKGKGGLCMKYVILVSHGTFAPGLHSVLKMLGGGDREDVLSASMEDGMGADDFVRRFEETIAPVTAEDEIILLADIIGGSPLTNALDVLSKKGMLGKTTAFGGMNLPMALTASMMKDVLDEAGLEESLISESRNAVQKMVLAMDEDEGEI